MSHLQIKFPFSPPLKYPGHTVIHLAQSIDKNLGQSMRKSAKRIQKNGAHSLNKLVILITVYDAKFLCYTYIY